MTSPNEFLNIVKNKERLELLTAVQGFSSDEELIKELFDIIENNHASTVADCVCEALFNIYSTQQQDCVVFCMQFIPALLWAYYSCLSRKVKWNASKIEVLLLLIYNEVVQENNEAARSFCIPTLSKASVYHEPYTSFGSTLTLTENALSQHEKSDIPIPVQGPNKYLDRIPAGYRSLVTKTVLHQYNVYISCFSPASLISHCNMICRLSKCGYKYVELDFKHISKEHMKLLQSYPKVNLNYHVINEMVISLHFISYNGFTDDAVTVLRELHQKATYTLCSAGILSTQSLLNLIDLSTKAEATFDILSPVNPTNSTYRGQIKLANLPSKIYRTTTPPPSLSLSLISPEPKASSNKQAPIAKIDNINIQLDKKMISANDIDNISPAISPVAMTASPKGKRDVDETDIPGNIKISLTSAEGNSKNLRYIEKELIEYTKNNDKTPLINGGEESDNGVAVVKTSVKRGSAENLQKTLHSPVETKM